MCPLCIIHNLKSQLRKDIIMLWNNKYVIKVLYVMRVSVYRQASKQAGRHCFTWYTINFCAFLFFPFFFFFLLETVESATKEKHPTIVEVGKYSSLEKKHYLFVTARISSAGKRIHRHRHHRRCCFCYCCCCCVCLFFFLFRSCSLPVLIEKSNCQWIFGEKFPTE